jgi:hypothetical protein
LKRDLVAYPDYDHPSRIFLTKDGTRFDMDETSRCKCGEFYNPLRETSLVEATLFTETHVIPVVVETQLCDRCNGGGGGRGWRGLRGTIGPDCSKFGIFNDNNGFLYSHELLNEYTISMATSEQTLKGFGKQMVAKYLTNKSPRLFPDPQTFFKVR